MCVSVPLQLNYDVLCILILNYKFRKHENLMEKERVDVESSV